MSNAKDSSPKTGFILHLFQKSRLNRITNYGIGKLSTGETFGLLDQRITPSFFIPASTSPHLVKRLRKSALSVDISIKSAMDGEPLLEVKSQTLDQFKKMVGFLEESGVHVFEADIPLLKKYAIENGIKGAVNLTGLWTRGKEVDWVIMSPIITPTEWEPDLSVLSIDIETNREASFITAISFVFKASGNSDPIEKVIVVRPGNKIDHNLISTVPTEYELLNESIVLFKQFDPDIITGWNVIDFDFKVLTERFKAHEIPFRIGRSTDACYFQEGSVWGGSRMRIFGRQVMDAMRLARVTLARYEDYRLETVSQSVLGRGKLLKTEGKDMVEIIERTRVENPKRFAEYCLEDAKLVLDILEKEDLIRLSLKRCQLTGLSLDNAWGSVAAFEFLYLSELHKRKLVASIMPSSIDDQKGVPGGHVFPPVVGVHKNVFVFDFKSLYPSIIRTFNIDPLSRIRAKRKSDSEVIITQNGARFDREKGILPEMLDIFFTRRAEAKSQKNDLASYTYKIVMNSFYGVLGTPTCRFASGQLAGAITHTGHYLLKWSKDQFEELGCKILYGDTDSLFVDAGIPDDSDLSEIFQKGNALCQMINSRLADHLQTKYGVESRLELEFEKVYRKLFLPPSRGQESVGRAKGYAGLIWDDNNQTSLQIVGMEAVRRDWTALSHQFQKNLLLLMFNETPPVEIEQFILNLVNQVRTGKKDNLLTYKKALRKPVESYTKTTPPHVRAARMLTNPSGVIHYVMTINGPQPAKLVSAPIDYSHYISRQIKPIVDTIAPFCGINTHTALTGERQLF